MLRDLGYPEIVAGDPDRIWAQPKPFAGSMGSEQEINIIYC